MGIPLSWAMLFYIRKMGLEHVCPYMKRSSKNTVLPCFCKGGGRGRGGGRDRGKINTKHADISFFTLFFRLFLRQTIARRLDGVKYRKYIKLYVLSKSKHTYQFIGLVYSRHRRPAILLFPEYLPAIRNIYSF